MPTAVCDIAPNSSDDTMVVTGSDPRVLPVSDVTHMITRRAIPPCPMISPARMKNGMASSGTLSRLPNMPVCSVVNGTSATNRIATSEVVKRMR